jgi:Plavaka transposase
MYKMIRNRLGIREPLPASETVLGILLNRRNQSNVKRTRDERSTSECSDSERDSIPANARLRSPSPSPSIDEADDMARTSTANPTQTQYEYDEPQFFCADTQESPRSMTMSEKYYSSSDEEACMICGSVHGWATLVQCDGCECYIHLKCMVPQMDKVPEGPFFCREKCMEIKKLDGVKGLNLESNGETVSDHGRSHGNLLRSTALNFLSVRESRPLHFASMCQMATEGHGITASFHHSYVEAIEQGLDKAGMPLSSEAGEFLRSMKPPIDTLRLMRSCGSPSIIERTITHHFSKKNVYAVFVLYFRSPLDVAIELYESLQIRLAGPIHNADTNHAECDTGRLPNIAEKIQRFETYVGLDRQTKEYSRTQLTIPVGMFSDESTSASTNVRFNPLWLYLPMCDPDVRFRLGRKAHGLIGMLPDENSIQFRFGANLERKGNDSEAEMQLSKKQKKDAFEEIFRKSVIEIFKDIKQYEIDGRTYGIGEAAKDVRIVLTRYVCDMKERRLLLSLKRDVWHCTHCYDFAGKHGKSNQPLGKRSTSMDKQIRKTFMEGCAGDGLSAAEIKSQFQVEHGKHGLSLKDKCAFTTVEDARIYFDDGPYEVFSVDFLHLKDGILIYLMSFFEEYLGESFVQETMKFGNLHLCTKKFSMHIMEKGIESFHFVPLALLYGKFERDIRNEERLELFDCACLCLKVLYLAADPCPSYVLQTLKETIAAFEGHVISLLRKISQSSCRVTTKMHELFAHVVDQVKDAGLPNAFSTKVFEITHEEIKYRYANNSSKRRDSQAFKEILNYMFYSRAMDETLILQSNPILLETLDAPFAEAPKFFVLNQQSISIEENCPAKEILNNATRIANKYFGTKVPRTPSKEDLMNKVSDFGNSVRMSLFCSRRKVYVSTDTIAVVPGTSLGKFYVGGTCNVIAFGPCEETTQPKRSKISAEMRCTCRHHQVGNNLFCSFSNVASTSYGLPLLFDQTHTYIWDLNPVHKSFPPVSDVIIPVSINMNQVRRISYKRIRGICMYRPPYKSVNDKCGFVFTGINVFGFT